MRWAVWTIAAWIGLSAGYLTGHVLLWCECRPAAVWALLLCILGVTAVVGTILMSSRAPPSK